MTTAYLRLIIENLTPKQRDAITATAAAADGRVPHTVHDRTLDSLDRKRLTREVVNRQGGFNWSVLTSLGKRVAAELAARAAAPLTPGQDRQMYERTENGNTTRVTAEEALKEGKAAMLDRVTIRAHVRKVSGDSGRYDITYKDGRRVVLRPVDGRPEPTATQLGALYCLYDSPGDPGFYRSARTRDRLHDLGLIDRVRGRWVVTHLGRVVLGVAEPAQELPAGTRVTTTVGTYAGQVGTVQEANRGTVTDTDSEHYGRRYVSVRWDPTAKIPWGETFRPFVDELTVAGAPAAPDTCPVCGKEDCGNQVCGTERPHPSACKHGNAPRPDVTGDP